MSTSGRKRKLEDKDKTSKKKKFSAETDDGKTALKSGIFSGFSIYVLPAGLGKARVDIFTKQLSKNGAEIEQKCSTPTTHVIVDEAMTSVRFLNITKLDAHFFNKTDGSSPVVVKANWLSTCLSEGKLLGTDEYGLVIENPRIDNKVIPKIKNVLPVKNIGGTPQSETKILIATESKKDEEILVNDDDAKILVNDDDANILSSSIGHVSSTPSVSPLKQKVQGEGYGSDDSNYVPSDEEEDDPHKPTSNSEGETSSNTSTPVASPVKLPVSGLISTVFVYVNYKKNCFSMSKFSPNACAMYSST